MKRSVGAALAALLIVPVAGIAARAAVPGGTPGPGFAAVGPVSATDGYPVWYKDKNGLRVERCVAAADPRCPARGPLPDETAPISFPDNYPDESFYSLASASLNTGNGGKATIGLALESAFASGPVIPGDQTTFARVRIKFTNAHDGVDYKVTTPAGVKTLQTNGKTPGLVFDTEDIGIGGQGDFTGALGGRLGPFLTWDSFGNKSDAALLADTYIGDGVTPHKVKGSPFGTNLVRIEGPGINPSATTDGCPTVAGPVPDCLETDLFTLQGKVATTAGVTPQQAAFARSSGSGGVIDVYAASDSGAPQAIQVADAGSSPAFAATGMVGEDGQYFARVSYTGATPPAAVRITNSGDVPATVKTLPVTDRVVGTASYDTDSSTLSVHAQSSDTSGSPALTATGLGSLSGGDLTVSRAAPPVTVTVTSSEGGTLTVPVLANGSARAPIPVVAMAGPDQVVQPGQKVTLDGSASSGTISTYAWTSPNGITVTPATAVSPTFTAPTAPGDYTITLTVNGPGGPSSATVLITVGPAVTNVTANAGPAATAQRGTVVTLDGSASVGAASYAWTQVLAPGDPTVTLTGATTARPTFTFPFYKAPANNGPLRFQLQVGNVGGTQASTAVVSVTPTSDTVVVTAARFATGKWRVDGTSSIIGNQQVTVHLGSLAGTVIGTGPVDALGAFSVRPATGPAVTGNQVVVVESQLGGVSTPFTVRIG